MIPVGAEAVKSIKSVMGNKTDMDKKFLEEIQERVIILLKTLSNDLHIVAKDRCSEVARLVGCWISDECYKCRIQICKGTFSDGSAHDILVVENNGALSLIDPTIWQIFPESSSIFIGTAGNIQETSSLLTEKYSGSWKISEDLYKCSDDFQKKLLEIIKNSR